MKKLLQIMFLLGLVMVLSGCADTVTFSQAGHITPVGFWYGVWHGMILPFSWIVSLFDNDVAIYAIYNNGGWYDFGYIFGISMLGSSSAAI